MDQRHVDYSCTTKSVRKQMHQENCTYMVARKKSVINEELWKRTKEEAIERQIREKKWSWMGIIGHTIMKSRQQIT